MHLKAPTGEYVFSCRKVQKLIGFIDEMRLDLESQIFVPVKERVALTILKLSNLGCSLSLDPKNLRVLNLAHASLLYCYSSKAAR